MFHVPKIPGTMPFLSTEGKRQIALDEQFLSKRPDADLKPQEILVSVNIPYSRKVIFSFQFPGVTCQLIACLFLWVWNKG